VTNPAWAAEYEAARTRAQGANAARDAARVAYDAAWLLLRRAEREQGRAQKELREASRKYENQALDVCGLYLMHDAPAGHFKIGQSVSIRDRLRQVRSVYPDTEVHSYVRVPEGALLLLEPFVLAAADRACPRRCDTCARGDWYCLDGAGVARVQAAMQHVAGL